MATEPEFHTRAEFAQMLGLTTAALADWEKRGYGPAPVKAGPRTNLYRKDEVAAFLAECASAPTNALLAERDRVSSLYTIAPAGSYYVTARDLAVKEGMSAEVFASLVAAVEHDAARQGIRK